MNQQFTTVGIIATLSVDELHRRLASFNTKRFAPALPESNWRDDLCAFVDGATLEGEFLDAERERVSRTRRPRPSRPGRFRCLVSRVATDWTRARTTRFFPGSRNRPAWRR